MVYILSVFMMGFYHTIYKRKETIKALKLAYDNKTYIILIGFLVLISLNIFLPIYNTAMAIFSILEMLFFRKRR